MKRFKVVVEFNEIELIKFVIFAENPNAYHIKDIIDKLKGKIIIEEVESRLDELQDLAPRIKELKWVDPQTHKKNNSIPSFKRPRHHRK